MHAQLTSLVALSEQIEALLQRPELDEQEQEQLATQVAERQQQMEAYFSQALEPLTAPEQALLERLLDAVRLEQHILAQRQQGLQQQLRQSNQGQKGVQAYRR